jgi:hypothetical protein
MHIRLISYLALSSSTNIKELSEGDIVSVETNKGDRIIGVMRREYAPGIHSAIIDIGFMSNEYGSFYRSILPIGNRDEYDLKYKVFYTINKLKSTI